VEHRHGTTLERLLERLREHLARTDKEEMLP
jgi:hypothetical protein